MNKMRNERMDVKLLLITLDRLLIEKLERNTAHMKVASDLRKVYVAGKDDTRTLEMTGDLMCMRAKGEVYKDLIDIIECMKDAL